MSRKTINWKRTMLKNIGSSSRVALPAQHMLELANIHLENACKAQEKNSPLALVHCDDALHYMKQAVKSSTKNADHPSPKDVAIAYCELGRLQALLGEEAKSRSSYRKARKFDVNIQDQGRSVQSSSPNKQELYSISFPSHIFTEDKPPHIAEFKPPEADQALSDIPQLYCCLSLLQEAISPDNVTDPMARRWLRDTTNNEEEQERLRTLATEVVRAYMRDELKDSKVVAEVLYLAPILENKAFQDLLREFTNEMDKSRLLNVTQLQGLAQLIQSAKPGQFTADDLNEILTLLSKRLQETHVQSSASIYQLVLAVSYVLDGMADANVEGIDRLTVHEPLTDYLENLKGSTDSYLVYQAAYAYQALLCVRDNETTWQAAKRRTGKVIQGVSGLVSAVQGLDLNKFFEGLGNIKEGLKGAVKVVETVATAYDKVTKLTQSGQDLMASLKEGFSFTRQRAWYSALRGADIMIRDRELAKFRKLVCEAPCRLEQAFQWGVCQRLGEIAANRVWDADTRRDAIDFLGEIYRNDAVWGQFVSIKQWILNLLDELSSIENELEVCTAADDLLQQLRTDGNIKKQELYRLSRSCSSPYPLKVASSIPVSSTLLDRAQNRPDVESSVRQLRRRREKERGAAVYIPPQAKASLEAADDTGRPLMGMVEKFLDSTRKVFLILGDPGAGKSTFNRELEFSLWKSYKPKNGRIPLHINLPAIDKPEYDMVAKQLRRSEFTEPQIRELKTHREFILICDGYDEGLQTHNLYMSNRLNQPGEWKAKMLISCRSEYLGSGYQDRFQPVDRNQGLRSALFQEAVITPFTFGQVQEYIKLYVSIHQPLWQTKDYKQALELIPSLKELVKNPFLMTLSLEVLPRMVDPGQHLSATRVTKVALYDHFIKQWLERGKKRLEEKDLGPQAKAVFESMSREGFTQNGLDFLKRLSMEIYREQDGHPIVQYSRYKDESSWKATFFGHEDEKQLLLEVCPMTRNGNQHRFIHRSLLEFGLALAIFDPHDNREIMSSSSVSARRQSAGSIMSFEVQGISAREAATISNEPNLKSPLMWRNLLSDPSILQFLEERAQLEPVFKQQLFSYIEHSKNDEKWRIAAANSITILVRAGVQFNGAQFDGIRIPGADLSYGVFDSAQLRGADLRKVNLRNTWLRKANLSEVKLARAQFGELPFLMQDDGVQSCVYSSDGMSFATALSNGKVNVYSTSNWTRTWTLEGHSSTARCAVFSPTGNQIASCSEDGTVRLWNIDTSACDHVFSDQSQCLEVVAFSPQGDFIATASNNYTVELWDAKSGDRRMALVGHSDAVNSLAYSPSGALVASASDDMTICIWETHSGECRQTLSGHRGGVCSVVYSPKGNQVASSSFDMTVRLWSIEDTFSSRILCHDGWVNSVVYSPQGDMVASASDDTTIRLWDSRTGALRRVLTGHDGSVTSVVFSPQGDMVASTSIDRTVRFWDVKTEACHIMVGHSNRVNSIAFSPKGGQIASGSDDNSVRLWDVAAGTSRHVSSGHSDEIARIRYSAEGNQIASCSNDGSIRLWNVETGTCSHILQGHGNTVRDVAYSPDGKYIASGCSNGEVRLWNAKAGICLHVLGTHSGVINGVAFSPQGDQVASASNDRIVWIWGVETGEYRQTLEGHAESVLCVTFSLKGTQIASGSEDSTVRLWNVENGTCQHILKGHGSRVNSVVYSPSGKQVASASHDNTVRLWDVDTGTYHYTFTGHTDSVFVVHFSPRGDMVVSGGKDKTVRLWNVERKTCQVMADHTDIVTCIAFSPKGDLIASGSGDCNVMLWDFASGQRQVVAQDFQGWVNDISWSSISDTSYLIVGCHDGSMRMWQIDEKDLTRVCLRWRTTKAELTVKDAVTQNMVGLTTLNAQLLKQRGAVDRG
ncbi:MAG: hypothetical protein J3Q66DRAFT_437695 [Benniella sp.]|nr:MAG: hypothetical protein J3Q66DRAFT_437695 [Benniella sp.]